MIKTEENVFKSLKGSVVSLMMLSLGLKADIMDDYMLSIMHAVQAVQNQNGFTYERLRGETFHVYEIESGAAQPYVKFVFSDSNRTVETRNLLTDELYGANDQYIIEGSKFQLTTNGNKAFYFLGRHGDVLLTYHDRIMIWSATALGDYGQSIYDDFAAQTSGITEQDLQTNTWYALDVSRDDEGHFGYRCGSRQTFNGDGTVTHRYLNNVNGLVQEQTTGVGDLSAFIARRDGVLLFEQSSFLFDSYDGVQGFIESYDGLAQPCLRNYAEPEDMTPLTLAQLIEAGGTWLSVRAADAPDETDRFEQCYTFNDDGLIISFASEQAESFALATIDKGAYVINQVQVTAEQIGNMLRTQLDGTYVDGNKTFSDIFTKEAAVHQVWDDDEKFVTWYRSDNCLALIRPDDDQGGSNQVAYTIDDGVSPTVITYLPGAIPSDMNVRITAKSHADANEWEKSIECAVQSDGTFENTCWIEDGYQAQIDAVLADADERYHVAIYKNSKNPDENRWDCGEDLYKFVGIDMPNWSGITVDAGDYQDRSGDSCGND